MGKKIKLRSFWETNSWWNFLVWSRTEHLAGDLPVWIPAPAPACVSDPGLLCLAPRALEICASTTDCAWRGMGSTEGGLFLLQRKSSLYLSTFCLAGISKASPLNQGCRHCLHFLFTETGRLNYAKFLNPVYLLSPSEKAQCSCGLSELSSTPLPELHLPIWRANTGRRGARQPPEFGISVGQVKVLCPFHLFWINELHNVQSRCWAHKNDPFWTILNILLKTMTWREEQCRSHSFPAPPPCSPDGAGGEWIEDAGRGAKILPSGPKSWSQCSELLSAGMLFCAAELCIPEGKEKINQLRP